MSDNEVRSFRIVILIAIDPFREFLSRCAGEDVATQIVIGLSAMRSHIRAPATRNAELERFTVSPASRGAGTLSGELRRDPELASLFYESGPGQTARKFVPRS